MGQAGKFTQALSRLTNVETDLPLLGPTPLLKFIDPFVYISSNIIKQALVERTPLGLLSREIRNDLLGKNGTIAQDKAQARMIVGTAMATLIGGLAAEGLVSGSGPSDPHEAMAWRLAGNQAHSVRVGDIWYDLHRLGPMGMLMGIGADLYDVAHQANEGELLKAASVFQHAITQNILDESFMRGPSDLIRAVEDPGRYGEGYLRNFVSSFVPYSVAGGQIARMVDPYTRQARTTIDAMKQKIPGLSSDLMPRRDIWGEPLPNKERLLGLTAIYEQNAAQDPVNQVFLQSGYFPAPPARKIRGIELTEQQYDEYSRLAGRMAKQRLSVIVQSPDWLQWPPNVRHDVVQATIRQSREVASGYIMAKDPTIIERAVRLKQEGPQPKSLPAPPPAQRGERHSEAMPSVVNVPETQEAENQVQFVRDEQGRITGAQLRGRRFDFTRHPETGRIVGAA
jgi:hypothetical protein